jgi:hypothetical protein
MKYLFLLSLLSCANLTESGAKVRFVEEKGALHNVQATADRMVAKHDCEFVGYVDAETSLFPGSYSSHENEIHSALRNRAAKIGANVVVANFYHKPAQGVGLMCPEEYLNQVAE